MSVVAKAYGCICEALDTQPTLQTFLADQAIEWGKISVLQLDADRWQQIQRNRSRGTLKETETRTPEISRPSGRLLLPLVRNPRSVAAIRVALASELRDFAVLPLPSRSLSLPEKAMVLVAIYNARVTGREPIDPWCSRSPESRLMKRVQTLVQAQAYDQDADEFGLTMDDLSTIRSYLSEVVTSSSAVAKKKTPPKIDDGPDYDYMSDGNYLTASYCSANYEVTASYLSNYTNKECIDLDPPRTIRRKKIRIDDGEKTRSLFCYFRADMEEIARSRTERLDR